MLIAASRIVPATGEIGVLAPGYLICAEGRVTEVGAGQPPGPPDLELADGILLPGFVDLQVNGYFGIEFQAADADDWATVAARLPETGTTAFLPTFITSPPDDLLAALRRAATFVPGMATVPGRQSARGSAGGSAALGKSARPAVMGTAAESAGQTVRPAATATAVGSAGQPAARVLGIHLEGPFIARNRRGAHNPAWILDPDPALIDALLAAGSGLVRVVTLAPELDGALAVIRQLAQAGVLVSIGHSDATGQQVSAAARCGATMVTHLFNAQRPMHHREPGVVGQALSDVRLTSGLIADLRHVSGQVAAIAFAAAPGRICLVTDGAACAGMPPGRYVLGGQPIELPPGDAEPPVRADGTLAGSALRMDTAVANMVAAGVGLVESVAAATAIPANLIGRADLGRIAAGAAADLAWLSDDLRTKATWIAGRQVYRSDPSSSGAPSGEAARRLD